MYLQSMQQSMKSTIHFNGIVKHMLKKSLETNQR